MSKHDHPMLHNIADHVHHEGDYLDSFDNAPNSLTGANPTADKQYVDDSIATAIGDLIDKGIVDVATTGALPANTRTGDVLKADAVGALPAIDGVVFSLGGLLLVKDEGGVASHINNGLYTLTVVGDGATEWELTRNSNLANGDSAAGAFVHVEQGTVNADSTFRCINNVGSDVVNTDALEWLYWGQTTDHKYLKNLNWSVSAHVLDKHPLFRLVSQTKGSDGSGDGTIAYPFATGQAAIDSFAGSEGTVIMDESCSLHSVTIPATKDITIMAFQAIYDAGNPSLNVVTLSAASTFRANNMRIQDIKGDVGIVSVTTVLEDCLVADFSQNVDKLSIHLAGTILSAASLTAIASAAFLEGYAKDSNGKFYAFNGIDANSQLIEDVLDPVSAQDAATKNYVDDFFDTTTGHDHDGVDSKKVDHGDLVGVGVDDHHAQLHAASHKDGAGDELDVSELAGALGGAGEVPETDGAAVSWVDPDGRYDPKAHKDSHDPNDGSDKLDCAAPGSIDENANAEGTAHSFARSDHNHQHLATLHENGGGAEISVTGLSGLLADDQHVLDSEVRSAVQYQADVSLAGVAPVDADVAGWAAGDRGQGIGTGGREFYMVKRGTAVKYVELT